MIHPTEKDIGRRVSYRSYRDAEFEYGRITSFNEHTVFVKYDGYQNSMATPRSKLEWVNENYKIPGAAADGIGGTNRGASSGYDYVDGKAVRVYPPRSKDWNNG